MLQKGEDPAMFLNILGINYKLSRDAWRSRQHHADLLREVDNKLDPVLLLRNALPGKSSLYGSSSVVSIVVMPMAESLVRRRNALTLQIAL